nr:MAG TPA: hypothetical protein [Caudoviricetes sp.]
MTINNFDKKSLEEDMKIGISSDDAIDKEKSVPDPSSQSFAVVSDKGYRSDVEPESYLDLLRPNRKNRKIDGFDFDLDTFENLVSVWTPKKNFTRLLHCSASDLDVFCMKAYNMKFTDAYDTLSDVADVWARRAINNLAQRGNNTALACVIKHFMKLEENSAPQPNITIVNDLGNGKFSSINNDKDCINNDKQD